MTVMTTRAMFALSATALATLLSLPAEAQELRVSSFEPQQGFFSQTIQAWIDEVTPELTDASMRLYPGSILGAPPAQADLVAAGVADIALVVPTYTAGLFPATSVAEVPGLIDDSATGTEILNTMLEEGILSPEYADYRILALFTTPGYRIFSTEPVTLPTDLEGMRLRSPSAFGARVLEMLGASGVPIPAPQVYENIERDVVSGAAWTMDGYRTFRLNEVAPNITETRLIATPFAILMNEASYQRLSEADRAVLDDHSGRGLAEWIAVRIDDAEIEIEAALREAGEVTFIPLDEAAQTAWDEALANAGEAWVSGHSEAGIDAAAILSRAQEISVAN